jgi:hypothetical protein
MNSGQPTSRLCNGVHKPGGNGIASHREHNRHVCGGVPGRASDCRCQGDDHVHALSFEFPRGHCGRGGIALSVAKDERDLLAVFETGSPSRNPSTPA